MHSLLCWCQDFWIRLYRYECSHCILFELLLGMFGVVCLFVVVLGVLGGFLNVFLWVFVLCVWVFLFVFCLCFGVFF